MTTENEGGGSSRIDEVNIERADLAERAVGCARGPPPIDNYCGIGRLIGVSLGRQVPGEPSADRWIPDS